MVASSKQIVLEKSKNWKLSTANGLVKSVVEVKTSIRMDGSGFDPGFYPPMPGSYGPYMGYPPFPMPGPSFAPHYGSFGPPEVPFTNEVEKVTNVKGKKKVWC